MKKTLIYLEYIAYFAAILYIASGSADGFIPIDSFSDTILTLFLGGTISLIALIGYFQRGFLFHSRSILIQGLLISAAIHTITGPNTPYYDTRIYNFYYLLIIIGAISGNFSYFLIGALIITTSDLGRTVIQIVMTIQKSFTMVDELVRIIPHTGSILGTGLIVYLLAIINKKKEYVPVTKMSLDNSITQSISRKRLKQEDDTRTGTLSALANTATGTFSIADAQETKVSTIENKEGEELSSVVFFMSRIFNAYSALGFVFDPSRSCFILNSYHSKSMDIIPRTEIAVGNGVVGTLAVSRVSFLSGNATTYYQDHPYYSKNEVISSVLAVPILSSTNELLGALLVDSKDKLAFRDNHRDILTRFSHLAAGLILNVRMRKFQERTAQQSLIFYETSQKFTQVEHPGQVIDILLSTIASMVPHISILALDFLPQTGQLVLNKIAGEPYGRSEGYSFPLNDGIFSQVIKKRQIATIDLTDPATHSYYYVHPQEQTNPAVKSMLIIPLAITEHYCAGLIAIESDVASIFKGEATQLCATLISNAAVAFQKASLFQKMERLATTDGLTQLCNHRTFQTLLQDEISRTLRYNHTLCLIIMDIDHFKKFNDTYGHTVGDLVLKEIAVCIKKSVRTNDIPARYGGEEFAVILPETDIDSAMIIGERIRKNVETFVIATKTQQLHVSVSVGCACLPLHTSTAQDLINFADAAMYHSKNNGRNQFTLYNRKIEMNVKK